MTDDEFVSKLPRCGKCAEVFAVDDRAIVGERIQVEYRNGDRYLKPAIFYHHQCRPDLKIGHITLRTMPP